jgi:hypothetical protein
MEWKSHFIIINAGINSIDNKKDNIFENRWNCKKNEKYLKKDVI